MITLDNGLQVDALYWPAECPVCGHTFEIEFKDDRHVPDPLPEVVRDTCCCFECAHELHLQSLSFENV